MFRQDRGLSRLRVDEQHAVGCRENEPLVIRFDPLVESRRPGESEPAPVAVRGQVRPLQYDRQQTRQLEVCLLHQHLAGDQIDRVAALEPANEILALLDGVAPAAAKTLA